MPDLKPQSKMEENPQCREVHGQAQRSGIVHQIHPLMSAKHQAENSRRKTQRHNNALQNHQADEFRLEVRRNRKPPPNKPAKTSPTLKMISPCINDAVNTVLTKLP